MNMTNVMSMINMINLKKPWMQVAKEVEPKKQKAHLGHLRCSSFYILDCCCRVWWVLSDRLTDPETLERQLCREAPP